MATLLGDEGYGVLKEMGWQKKGPGRYGCYVHVEGFDVPIEINADERWFPLLSFICPFRVASGHAADAICKHLNRKMRMYGPHWNLIPGDEPGFEWPMLDYVIMDPEAEKGELAGRADDMLGTPMLDLFRASFLPFRMLSENPAIDPEEALRFESLDQSGELN